jgi:hypothetical protein
VLLNRRSLTAALADLSCEVGFVRKTRTAEVFIAQFDRIVPIAFLVIARFVLARLSSRPDRCYQRGGRGARHCLAA